MLSSYSRHHLSSAIKEKGFSSAFDRSVLNLLKPVAAGCPHTYNLNPNDQFVCAAAQTEQHYTTRYEMCGLWFDTRMSSTSSRNMLACCVAGGNSPPCKTKWCSTAFYHQTEAAGLSRLCGRAHSNTDVEATAPKGTGWQFWKSTYWLSQPLA